MSIIMTLRTPQSLRVPEVTQFLIMPSRGKIDRRKVSSEFFESFDIFEGYLSSTTKYRFRFISQSILTNEHQSNIRLRYNQTPHI